MNAPDCLFCRIASGELEADLLLEREHLFAFRDIAPQAPVHILITPREHVESLNGLEARHLEVAGRLLLCARELAEREGLAEGGWRLVVNVGRDGGQAVGHLHVHLLGGRAMDWPPG